MQSWVAVLDQFAEKSNRLVLAIQSLPPFQKQRHNLISKTLWDMVLLTQSLDSRVTAQLGKYLDIDITISTFDPAQGGNQEGFERNGCGRAPRNISPPVFRVNAARQASSFGDLVAPNNTAPEAYVFVAAVIY